MHGMPSSLVPLLALLASMIWGTSLLAEPDDTSTVEPFLLAADAATEENIPSPATDLQAADPEYVPLGSLQPYPEEYFMPEAQMYGYAPVSGHRCSLFAECLVLRPGNTDMTYAVERTGCDPALSSPTGPVGTAGVDVNTGLRGGFTWALSPCCSVVTTYTWFESDTVDSILATPGNVLASQVTHPSQASCGANSLAAWASHEIDFQTVDVDYRRLFYGDCDCAINWLVGLRYGRLEQRFQAIQNTGVATGTTDVTTDIDFDGFGFRLGLDGERRNARTGLMFYGKGFANFLGGEWKADYRHVNQFGGTGVIGNSLEDYRMICQLEAELGVGWINNSGRIRVTAGYLTTGWFNAVTTDDYVRSVRSGIQHGIGDNLTFNGLTIRAEWRH